MPFALVAASTLSYANVIVNGDFEANGGSLDGWTLDVPAPSYLNVSTERFHSRSHSALWPDNFTSVTQTASIAQTFGPLTNVTNVELWAWSTDQSVTEYLKYSDGTLDVFTQSITGGQQATSDPTSGWTDINLTSNVEAGKFLTGLTISSTSGGFNNGERIYIDDVDVEGSAVPEPCSLLALGSGVAVLLRRRAKAGTARRGS